MSERPLYGSFAWAYDVLVRSTGPSAEFVAGQLPPGASVVDAGCGTGGHALFLAARGFRVIGIDSSAGLVEVAARRAGAARFEVADLLTWRPPAPCDAVLCRGVLNDIIEDTARAAAFDSFSSMLRPGGLLVADVRDWEASLVRYEGGRRFERTVEHERGTLVFRSETVPDEAGRLLRVREQLALKGAEVTYDFTMRCWTREELEERLVTAGFTPVELAPGLGGARADRLVVTAQFG